MIIISPDHLQAGRTLEEYRKIKILPIKTKIETIRNPGSSPMTHGMPILVIDDSIVVQILIKDISLPGSTVGCKWISFFSCRFIDRCIFDQILYQLKICISLNDPVNCQNILYVDRIALLQ